MQIEAETPRNKVPIGVGVALLALSALIVGFLLGQSGSEVVSDDAATDIAAVPEPVAEAADNEIVVNNPPAVESDDPPVAIPSVENVDADPGENAADTSTSTTSSEEPAPTESTTSTTEEASSASQGASPYNSPATAQAQPTTTQSNDEQPSAPADTAPVTPTTEAAPAETPADTAAPPSTAPRNTVPPVQQVAGQRLFVDPTNSAAQWASNNSTDPRAATIASEIGSQPIARWFGDWNGNVAADVAHYVDQAAAADEVPALVAYNIPDRDCGQHSSGGAANFAKYDAWISAFASGLGDSGAIIILEPDALALNGCAGSDRNDALADAVATIKSTCANCSVYLDAGHSNWVAPADMANRLIDAGVLASDGFFTNVSNYNATSNEAAFGNQVLNALGNPNGLGQVIDTSRNGNGANGEWCDAPGRAVGDDPTLQTGASNVDAFLWVKVPGEADGCIAGAGQFVPDRAFELPNG